MFLLKIVWLKFFFSLAYLNLNFSQPNFNSLIFFSVHTSLKTTLFRLSSECDRLKTACESENSQILNINPNVLITLRHSLNQALVQNNDLKNRLNRVHEIADLADLSSVGPASDGVRIIFFL